MATIILTKDSMLAFPESAHEPLLGKKLPVAEEVTEHPDYKISGVQVSWFAILQLGQDCGIDLNDTFLGHYDALYGDEEPTLFLPVGTFERSSEAN